ncbi:MAG: serine protein kinase RIO [Nanoarchaeota archaeon]|nr:serine protein kinase RIO [Nanoarchaeota archaeon]
MNQSDLKKVWGGVFDNLAIMALYKLLSKGTIKEIKSVIKEGKESQVLFGEPNIAIKVYAIKASNFKQMQPYIIDDARFRGIKKNKKSIIFAWCKKEFRNLEKARKKGVSCPKPIAFLNNVLVMEFLGKDGVPYPRLKDSKVPKDKKLFNEIIKNIKKLYKAGLVHADLSEYNILVGDKVYIIDMSQSVLTSHPNANMFLERDVHNVCKYFSKYFTVDYVKILEKIKF